MKDVMLSEMPVEQREAVLRDSCDQIVEKSYTRRFNQDEINMKRAELADKHIEISELEAELNEIKAQYKGRLKPLIETVGRILDELKSGGEYVKEDCYKFVDVDEGKTAFYAKDGIKIEERAILPEERQRNMFQTLRTGTND